MDVYCPSLSPFSVFEMFHKKILEKNEQGKIKIQEKVMYLENRQRRAIIWIIKSNRTHTENYNSGKWNGGLETVYWKNTAYLRISVESDQHHQIIGLKKKQSIGLPKQKEQMTHKRDKLGYRRFHSDVLCWKKRK